MNFERLYKSLICILDNFECYLSLLFYILVRYFIIVRVWLIWIVYNWIELHLQGSSRNWLPVFAVKKITKKRWTTWFCPSLFRDFENKISRKAMDRVLFSVAFLGSSKIKFQIKLCVGSFCPSLSRILKNKISRKAMDCITF